MFPLLLADNRFLDAAPTATGTAAGFDVLHIRDLRPYTFWQAAAAGTNYVTVDCLSAKPANCLALTGHNLGTAGATVTLESSPDNITWTSRFTFVPGDDRAKLFTITQIYARSWRLKIVTAAVAPRIAVLMVGVRLDFPFPADTPYVPCSETTEEETTVSKSGHALGTVVRYAGIEINPQFSHIPRAWLDDTWLPFHQSYARLRKYFFYAWDAERYPDQVYFVKSTGKFEAPLSTGRYVDRLKLQFKGVAEP